MCITYTQSMSRLFCDCDYRLFSRTTGTLTVAEKKTIMKIKIRLRLKLEPDL